MGHGDLGSDSVEVPRGTWAAGEVVQGNAGRGWWGHQGEANAKGTGKARRRAQRQPRGRESAGGQRGRAGGVSASQGLPTHRNQGGWDPTDPRASKGEVRWEHPLVPG